MRTGDVVLVGRAAFPQLDDVIFQYGPLVRSLDLEDLLFQLCCLERLGQEAVDPGLRGRQDIFLVRPARHHQHGQSPELFGFAHLPDKLDRRRLRQRQVDDQLIE